VIERPLFFEKRRPIAPPSTEAAPVEVSDFSIAGIVVSETDRHILVRLEQGGKTKRIREGETISDWSVEQILSDRVVLRRGDEVEELKPRERGQRNAKVASRPAPVRQPASALPLAAASPPRPNVDAARALANSQATPPQGRRRR
jgi:type II secretory pathway component PulC